MRRAVWRALASLIYAFTGAGVGVMFIRLLRWVYDAGLPRMAERGLSSFVWRSFSLLLGSSLLVGALTRFLYPGAAGSGIPQLKRAYGRWIPALGWRETWGKLLIGVISLGGGASLGRAGPTVFTGGAAASAMAGAFGENEDRRRKALVTGAAAGLAAAFNAPLAGAVFVFEEIAGRFERKFLGGAVLGAVVGAAATCRFVGAQPAFSMPAVSSFDWRLLLLAPFAAAFATAAALIFQNGSLYLRGKVLAGGGLPMWLRPSVGGMLTWLPGVAAFAMVGRLGVFSLGYDDIGSGMAFGMAWQVAVVLLVAKLAASVFSYGWGGCGGIFGPTLFFGAMCGLAVAGAADSLAELPGCSWLAGSADATVVLAGVGMCACFGAAARAPLTALLIIFETTYSAAVLPALVVGVLVSRVMLRGLGGERNFYDAVIAQDALMRGGP